jgi:hypothetical protein
MHRKAVVATHGGGIAPMGHLACPRLGNHHRHYGKAASLQIVRPMRWARDARSISAKRSAPRSVPYVAGMGWGTRHRIGSHRLWGARLGEAKRPTRPKSLWEDTLGDTAGDALIIPGFCTPLPELGQTKRNDLNGRTKHACGRKPMR